jgi:hypothetical protein
VTQQINTIVQRTDAFIKSWPARPPAKQPRLPESLLVLLGCPIPGTAIWPMIEKKNLEAARDSLPRLLRTLGTYPQAPVDATSLLAGLGRHKCWQRCLLNEDNIYPLAKALLNYTATYDPGFPMDAATERDVLSILNGWLRPGSRWRKLPSAMTVCETLFGTAWCTLALLSGEDYGRGLADIVAATRPPFRTGYFAIQDATTEMLLPELGSLP